LQKEKFKEKINLRGRKPSFAMRRFSSPKTPSLLATLAHLEIFIFVQKYFLKS